MKRIKSILSLFLLVVVLSSCSSNNSDSGNNDDGDKDVIINSQESDLIKSDLIVAQIGETIDLKDYVHIYDKTGALRQDQNFKAYVLESNQNSGIVYQKEAGDNVLTLLKAQPLYINIETDDGLFKTLKIEIESNQESEDISNYFSDLNNQFAVDYGERKLIHTDYYLYDSSLYGGYIASLKNETYYQYRLSSPNSSDLEVIVPELGSLSDMNEAIGSFSNINLKNIAYLNEPIEAGSQSYRYYVYGQEDLIMPIFRAIGLYNSYYVINNTYTYPYSVLINKNKNNMNIVPVLYDTTGSLYLVNPVTISSNCEKVDVVENYVEQNSTPELFQTREFIKHIQEISTIPNYTISYDYDLIDKVTGESVKENSDNEFTYFAGKYLKITKDALMSATYSSTTVNKVKYFLEGGQVNLDGNVYSFVQNTSSTDKLPVSESYKLKSKTPLKDSGSNLTHEFWYQYSDFSIYKLSTIFSEYRFNDFEVASVDGKLHLTPFTTTGAYLFQDLMRLFIYHTFIDGLVAAINTTVHPYIEIEDKGNEILVDFSLTIPKDSNYYQFENETQYILHSKISDIGTTSIPGIEELSLN